MRKRKYDCITTTLRDRRPPLAGDQAACILQAVHRGVSACMWPLQFIWQKCVFLSLPALGASAYVQRHMVTWLYRAPGRQSTDHAVLWSPFGTVYRRLFVSRQHGDNFKTTEDVLDLLGLRNMSVCALSWLGHYSSAVKCCYLLTYFALTSDYLQTAPQDISVFALIPWYCHLTVLAFYSCVDLTITSLFRPG